MIRFGFLAHVKTKEYITVTISLSARNITLTTCTDKTFYFSIPNSLIDTITKKICFRRFPIK